jgi:hypothetical protein
LEVELAGELTVRDAHSLLDLVQESELRQKRAAAYTFAHDNAAKADDTRKFISSLPLQLAECGQPPAVKPLPATEKLLAGESLLEEGLRGAVQETEDTLEEIIGFCQQPHTVRANVRLLCEERDRRFMQQKEGMLHVQERMRVRESMSQAIKLKF